MLQIITGKFFKGDKQYETSHKGLFYTNYALPEEAVFEASVGRLTRSDQADGLVALNYDILEKIEWVPPASGVMTSTGGKELIDDFSAVFSFVLNVTCTRDAALSRRLIGSPDPLRRNSQPSRFLSGVFDDSIAAHPDDAPRLTAFLTDLTAMKRRDFVAAMRAIQRYVTATHRVVDDTSLAYSLLVMAIEALTRTVEAPLASWLEYDQAKRSRIDKALKEADPEVADRVRIAVLENAHAAVGRLFRDFTITHLAPSFYRAEALDRLAPVSRRDLPIVLTEAYDLRSGYVHRLNAIPKPLLSPFSYVEVMDIARQPTLTIAGLARVVRHVIFRFVEKADKVEHEEFNWRAALPNVMNMQWASHYWLEHPDNYSPESASIWLEHFLGQASSWLLREPSTQTSDLSAVLDKIETFHLGSISPAKRRSIVALYHLFIMLTEKHEQRPKHKKIIETSAIDFIAPSIEELAIRLVLGLHIDWTLEQQEMLHKTYFEGRSAKQALRLGRLLESLFTLHLAEANRAAGDEQRARELISFSVEAWPGHKALMELEATLGSADLNPINAEKIMLPAA